MQDKSYPVSSLSAAVSCINEISKLKRVRYCSSINYTKLKNPILLVRLSLLHLVPILIQLSTHYYHYHRITAQATMAAAVAPINFETEIAYLKDPERVVSDEVVGDASLREPHKKIVYDMRPARDEFELDIHGFQILDIPLKERNDKDINEVTTKYFKEVEELLKDKLGAKHVYCFAPVLRPLDLADKPIPNTQKTIPRPHLDFGPASAAEWWKWFTDPGLQQGVPAWLESIGVDWNQPPRYSILG